MDLLHDLTKINIGSLTFFDITVLSVIGVSVVFGAGRGFVKSFISFVGWIIAFALAIKFSHNFLHIFEKYTTSTAMANVASTAALFLLFALILAIVNSLIVTLLGPLCGGLIDRSIGLFFGFIRGLIVVSAGFYFMMILLPALNVKDRSQVFEHNSKLPHWAQKSETLLSLAKGAHILETYIPNHFKEELQQSIEESMDSEGRLTSPVSKVEKIKHANQILNMLPDEVLNEISQEDILTLQDTDSSYKDKIRVLEAIADIYQRYNSQKVHLDSTNKSELHRLNLEHHRILSQIEEEIQKYNRLADKE